METPQKYVLGLDLGSASLGWAMIALDEAGDPTSLLHTGVRIFEPGVDGTSLDIQQGKDQSKAVDRRTARLHRRQLRRRAARQRELFQELQAGGLLPMPEGEAGANSEQRHALLNEFDQALARKYLLTRDDQPFAQLPLYLLRKRALDHPLEAFELGRVLFHLIQRRGFKSNRKETKKNAKDDDQGQVKADIHSLWEEIKAAGARTLGEYFAGLDPHNPTNDPKQKVRRRWTARAMFEKEFAAIWTAQAPHHPELLTAKLRERVAYLLFFQRPISAQKHLIGTCELERGDASHPPQKRAPWAAMAAQRFRILQKVNDLKLIDPRTGNAVALNEEERAKLYRLLDMEGTQSFIKIRKHLDIPKGIVFNLEVGGDKDLQGNRTQKSMLKVFGPRWLEFSEGKQNQIVDNWRNSESDDALMLEAKEHLGLDDAAAAQLVAENAPTDYCMLSLKAIQKLLPGMMDGRSFKDVETEIYGDRFSGLTVHDTVPQVRATLPTLRNPAVERSMTELRKVVNAIVREHGKPHEIRIELARELKKPRGERQKDTDKNRKRERERIDVAKKLFQEFAIQNPGRALIEKALLYEECGGICPYTGKSIRYSSLVNDSEFDIEHIIPRSRFPDNSFQNKTLCHQSMNQLKGNRTPYEFYKGNPEEYEKVLDRVRAWPVKNRGKLDRFRVGEPGVKDDNTLEGFSTRQLNDTRYTSVAAAKLLATLYGGREAIDKDGKKRQAVYATSGSITAALRSTWGLEEILRELVPPQPGDTRGKPRIDHRHHAVDAITIAATRPAVIAAMARDSARNIDPRTRPRIEQPWKNFIDSIRPLIEQMLVSHRPEHKLTGELHDETNYGRPYQANKKTMVHVRKPVAGLSPKDVANIVDPAIRQAVMDKAAELKGDLTGCDLKSDWPVLATRDGGTIPIKKVRIQKVLDVTPIGNETKRRYVAESSNHHIAIYAEMDSNGKEKRWDGVIVSLLEAYQRSSAAKKTEAYKQRRTLPIIQRALPGEENLQFKFSLMGGDTVELHRTCKHSESICTPEIYRIRTIAASGQLSLARINDARMKKDIIASKDWWQPGVDALRKLDCRKVVIDLQGRKRYAND